MKSGTLTGDASKDAVEHEKLEAAAAPQDVIGPEAPEARPIFSTSTKWTLLGLFSLGLFIDV